MNVHGFLLLGILLSSFVTGLVIFFLKEENHRLRTWLNLLGAGVKLILVAALLRGIYQGQTYSFAIEFLPGITIVYGSVRALFQDELKKRLAYSTVSQVSYIVLGVAIVGPMATIGGLVHLVNQGIMKITLFFCAGNYAETLGTHKVSEMNGVGRRMPLTTAAFTVAALGMIGVPFLAGAVTKQYLKLGTEQAGAEWVLWVLMASSFLNAAYFLPILWRAWIKAPPVNWPHEHSFARGETNWLLLLPPLVTAALVIWAGVFADSPFSPLAWVKLIAEREYGP